MKIFLSISFLLLFIWPSNAQEPKYTRIKSSGQAPAYVKYSTQERFDQTIIKTSPYRERDERISELYFYKSSSFWINRLLSSGNVIYGDVTHQYLTKLLAHILKSNDIDEQINIHLVNSPYVNAFATNEPILFINTGLIGAVRNEAELSFIICHELAHYLKKHGLEKHLDNYKFEKLKNDKDFNTYDYFLKKHHFSREKEAEADSLGFHYFVQSGYSGKHAVSVFDLLHNTEISYESSFLKGKKEIENLLSAYDKKLIDSAWTSMVVDTLENESLSTHPLSKNRQKKIRNMESLQISEGTDFILGKSEFENMQNIASNELVRLNLIHNRFFHALYYSSKNMHEGKEFVFYNEISYVKSLIGILKLKIVDPSLHPKFCDYSGCSGLYFTENSIFKSHAIYFSISGKEEIIRLIETKIKELLTKYPEEAELIALNNWFIDWQSELPAEEGTFHSGLSRLKSTETETAKTKKIYIDPEFLKLDLRSRHKIDFLGTEKLEIEAQRRFLHMNKMNKNLYVNKSIRDKKKLTTESMNENELIYSRLNEINNFPVKMSSFPTDYSEIDSLTNASQAAELTHLDVVSAKYKKPKWIAVIVCVIAVPLIPLGIYYVFSPSYVTEVSYYDVNLETGIRTKNDYARHNTKLNYTLMRKIYFTKNK